jgi:glycerol-3-phosphate dehydrogenase
MRRDLAALADRTFDVVVVGGGAFGVYAAWDAALRGLSVAVLERGDWAEAASANCFKMVHGGIRYLQHLDLPRIRQSSRERNTFLRTAPHLVRPLPILIPTYGHGRSGPEILGIGMRVYDLLAWDRNRGIRDPALRLPAGRVLSRNETAALDPDLPREGLTGAALIHDGQMRSPARLALCALRSAVERGACAANYVEVTGFLKRGSVVEGVSAVDRESGSSFSVRGRAVVNAAGAWSGPLLERSLGIGVRPRPTFSRDTFFVVDRRIGPDVALAVKGRMRDPDAVLAREARHLFLVPWNDRTLVGVWHRVHEGAPDSVALPDEQLQAFLDEINEAYPAARLTPDSVCQTHYGLVLFGENEPGATELSYGKRSRLIDHALVDGIGGLVTLLGVRYTTARLEAAHAVDAAVRAFGRPVPPSSTDAVRVHGGEVDDREGFLREAIRTRPATASETSITRLVQYHGSAYREVIEEAGSEPDALAPIPGLELTVAEIRHAVRREMARTLADLLFRRTDIGSGRAPARNALEVCASVMAKELAWDEARADREVRAVRSLFRTERSEVIA